MPPALADKKIVFSANAAWGAGGQGEFLRQMGVALQGIPKAEVYCRKGNGSSPPVWHPLALQALYRLPTQLLSVLPFLRTRRDWNVLLGDIDFDSQVAACVGHPDLFDGVAGQCCRTLKKLQGSAARRVVTCLNTHIDFLTAALEIEHKKIGSRGSNFVHPAMRRRMLDEIERADAVRVNSHWAKQTFIEAGVPEEKVHVIYPAIDREHFYPVEKKDPVFRVLAVSSIDPRKGIRYLLQAFEEARIPNSELVLIGGTGDRWSKNMVQSFLSRNKNIFVRQQDVIATPVEENYGMASVVVHPALEDGYGLVVAQALASGRPVIVTRQTGAAELVEDGQQGFVIESSSVTELKECLQCLANDEALRRTMSEAAAQRVKHRGYEQFAQDVQTFYQGVLK